MSIILYTTGCPRCKILEKKLEEKGIKYDICEDIGVMVNKGFVSAPMLELDGEIMDYTKANEWLNIN